ncbi:hypothetical protein NE848_12845 [Gramella jeungdoensis]|uniref:Uncharacterized protein n=1 Tax=Gramella jeungdoensis TaxID=708091 RepID=A0ABT0Z3I2_9FLAO|nr:hypothetical protein [Gramella jeungdoensis]MCM8570274.1 hypothetical protein [Gramella jeungdoensis]
MTDKEVIDELLALDLPIGLWSEVSREKLEREEFMKAQVEKHRFYIAIMDKLIVNNVVRVAFFYNPERNKSEDVAAQFFHQIPKHYEPIEKNVEFANWVFPYKNMTIPLRFK